MILTHIPNTWPRVEAGQLDAAEVTLGQWAGISDVAAERYGDVILGIYKNTVVTAYDVTGWSRVPAGDVNAGRIVFEGIESATWKHLVGQENPGEHWTQGQARPVKYLDTKVLTDGDVPIEEVVQGSRAVLDGFILTVREDGSAKLVIPKGREITIESSE